MVAKLTDHIWTIKELLMTVVPHAPSTRKGQTTCYPERELLGSALIQNKR
jgi:hypothetical protein